MKNQILKQMVLSKASYEMLEKAAILKTIPKHTIIAKPGKTIRKLLFVNNGLLRAYRLIDGQEYTHYFFLENWFATDYQSFLTTQPSELYIESLTSVNYYEFDKESLQKLYDQNHELERLGRIMAEQAYLKMVERLINFQTQSLKERYLTLINQNPELFQKAPQRMIASYLGVAEQSLSRIKTEWRRSR